MESPLTGQGPRTLEEEAAAAQRASRSVSDAWLGTEEVDAIVSGAFSANKGAKTGPHKGIRRKAKGEGRPSVARDFSKEAEVKRAKAAAEALSKEQPKESFLLVDGYNIIFAWEELRALAETNIESARGKLMDDLCDYQGYAGMTLILVFDAYKVKGHAEEIAKYHNIYVVYTKEAETADQYIEKTVHKIGRKYDVTVATSDGLEQMIIAGDGASRLSARGLLEEMGRLRAVYENKYKTLDEASKNIVRFPEISIN